MTYRRQRVAVVTAALTTVLTVGACSHGGGAGSAAVSAAAANATSRPAAASAAAGGVAGAATSLTSPVAQTSAVALVGQTSRIRTADMTVAVTGSRNVAGRADRAGVIAQAAGGEIDRDDRSAGSRAQADLVLRVPPGRLVPVLAQLSALGTEKSRRLASTDVTERVADVTSRVASAQQAVTRLRGLYAQAAKVSDVLAVEGELSSREAGLESLQAQQRVLARQTSLATITLTIVTAARAAAAPARDRGGFVGGLQRGWHAFTSAAAALATGAGAVLPFLALLLVVAALARVAWPRRPRRASTAPSAHE